MTRTPAHFSLAGTVLTVHGELNIDDEREFRRLLTELVATKSTDLCIDMRDVTYMSSTYIGMIVMTVGAATQAGAELVILTSPQVHKVLTMASVESLGNLRLCQG